MNIVFIVGSPRSGTTLLEYILGSHGDIAHWYEPYYIWEKYFSPEQSDAWQESRVDRRVKEKIRREYRIFLEKSEKKIVVDKLPTHAFNIRLIRQVFPEAKWIHLMRDGRDVTLSIKKEWEKRAAIVKDKKIGQLLTITWNMLARQPFLRFRLMAVIHELTATGLQLRPKGFFNKSRWQGYPGWGPRFNGWQEALGQNHVLAFNAMQWKTSVQAVLDTWEEIPSNQRMLVRYEDLLTRPDLNFERLAKFIGMEKSDQWVSQVPSIKSGNFNKWEKELSAAEINIFLPVIKSFLKDVGYSL